MCCKVPPAGHREDLRRSDQADPEASDPQGAYLGVCGLRLDIQLYADGIGSRTKQLCEFLLIPGHGAATDEGHG